LGFRDLWQFNARTNKQLEIVILTHMTQLK